MYEVKVMVMENGCGPHEKVVYVEKSSIWNCCDTAEQRAIIQHMHPEWKVCHIKSVNR